VDVDGVDLANFASAVSYQSEHERVPASGFNLTGASEFLAGETVQSVTVTFFGSYGTGEVHQTLYPIHKNREIVEFGSKPFMGTAVAADNPEIRGNVQLLTYSPESTRGDAESFSVEFVAADPNGIWIYDVAAP
jgi:hypothetical protein